MIGLMVIFTESRTFWPKRIWNAALGPMAFAKSHALPLKQSQHLDYENEVKYNGQSRNKITEN